MLKNPHFESAFWCENKKNVERPNQYAYMTGRPHICGKTPATPSMDIVGQLAKQPKSAKSA